MGNETAKRLSAITDEGLFERLATAVLRQADSLYAALAHVGVNAEGKTVKAPLDAIAYVPGANPPHMLAAHHTTTKASGLRTKWLHDPSTVKPRKNKPTGEAGDVIKTAGIAARERIREPKTAVTLALTTNLEPSIDLIGDVHALARTHDIELDLWSRSRIADFLDSPRGQWLRHQHLGLVQEHVSKELLAELSRKSLHQYQPLGDPPDVWIDRAIDKSLSSARGQTTFVVADAGLGKTVACYKALSRHIARGGFGLIIPHKLIEQSLTVSHAIDLALRQLYPHLAPDSGAQALQLCEAALPFVVVIEDINRSGKPAELLEKIAAWAIPAKSGPPAPWRVFCPTWPQILLGLKDQVRKGIDPYVLPCPLMTPAEARAAVQQRDKQQSLTLSSMDADTIAQALAYDPLLIALHNLRETPRAIACGQGVRRGRHRSIRRA
jgi:hypothetical protein